VTVATSPLSAYSDRTYLSSIEELMTLPGVGAKGADKILEMREAKGDLELEDLRQVPYLR
jgi:DNA uptake protein ComE-like DNA-binding protein